MDGSLSTLRTFSAIKRYCSKNIFNFQLIYKSISTHEHLSNEFSSSRGVCRQKSSIDIFLNFLLSFYRVQQYCKSKSSLQTLLIYAYFSIKQKFSISFGLSVINFKSINILQYICSTSSKIFYASRKIFQS